MEEGSSHVGELGPSHVGELELHVGSQPAAASLNVWGPRNFPSKLLLNKGWTSLPARQWADV